MNAIEEAIVVGIHPNEREREYTQPGYEDYGRFLVDTLKPLIDAKYRTLSGPANTAAMGSSLGGVVSFYLGWQWPEVFGKVACLSSTFTFRDDLIERVSAEPKRNPDLPRQRLAARQLRSHPQYAGSSYLEGLSTRLGLFYFAFPEARHDEKAWAARSPIPFQFLFWETTGVSTAGEMIFCSLSRVCPNCTNGEFGSVFGNSTIIPEARRG